MYKLILRMINRKNYKTIEGIEKKIDVLYMRNKLTDEEFEKLTVIIMMMKGE